MNIKTLYQQICTAWREFGWFHTTLHDRVRYWIYQYQCWTRLPWDWAFGLGQIRLDHRPIMNHEIQRWI